MAGRAAGFLEGLCRAFALVGALVLIALALVTVVSVLGRYFFNSPVTGDCVCWRNHRTS